MITFKMWCPIVNLCLTLNKKIPIKIENSIIDEIISPDYHPYESFTTNY